jgi:DNA-directed RNA polymerase beta' subunit
MNVIVENIKELDTKELSVKNVELKSHEQLFEEKEWDTLILQSPVAHIWFLKSMPSRIGLILGMNPSDVEKVVYFAGYLITKVNEDERKRFVRRIDSEFKAKTKNSQDEKTKEALKNFLD